MSEQEFRPILTKSGLSLEDDQLVRRDPKGKQLESHPLTEVFGAEIETQTDKGAVLLGAALMLLGAGAFRLIPGFGFFFGGLMILLGLLFIVSSKRTRLRVQTAHGDLSYNLTESAEQASGFIVALRRDIAEAQNRALSSPDDSLIN